jgi:hypothetical protein
VGVGTVVWWKWLGCKGTWGKKSRVSELIGADHEDLVGTNHLGPGCPYNRPESARETTKCRLYFRNILKTG